MDSYTITITPNDDSGNSTTLTVDTSTGQARITSVHMQAPTGLTGAQAPNVDVELLLQAVTGPTHNPAAITAASPPPTEAVPEPPAVNGDDDEPSPKATTVTPRKTARKKATPAAASAAERVYRRMPDDFTAVYRRTGTAAAIAAHYGVPRHTAQGWIRRQRKQDTTSTD
jgi:hypothetical protein